MKIAIHNEGGDVEDLKGSKMTILELAQRKSIGEDVNPTDRYKELKRLGELVMKEVEETSDIEQALKNVASQEGRFGDDVMLAYNYAQQLRR